jgi:hypothetical protein
MLGVPIKKQSSFLTPNEMGSIMRKAGRECEPLVTWIDPHTNVTVIILGCLHGSPSSTVELENILTQNRPAALVLELCSTRYLNMVKQRQSWNTNKISSDIKQLKEYGWTISGGNSRASIALGIASEFQNCLSGFEPGLEFVCTLHRYGLDPSCSFLTNSIFTSHFHFWFPFSIFFYRNVP